MPLVIEAAMDFCSGIEKRKEERGEGKKEREEGGERGEEG
jgi:hypothetical protein